MQTKLFVHWLTGFLDAIEAENESVFPYTQQIIVGKHAWKKLKSEIGIYLSELSHEELHYIFGECPTTTEAPVLKNSFTDTPDKTKPYWYNCKETTTVSSTASSGEKNDITYKAPDWYTETSQYNPDPII